MALAAALQPVPPVAALNRWRWPSRKMAANWGSKRAFARDVASAKKQLGLPETPELGVAYDFS
eukprot:COSAG01_NODE_1574_length_9861_cov_8.255071_6_plen_63_part_00